jgi:hypothetical protein
MDRAVNFQSTMHHAAAAVKRDSAAHVPDVASGATVKPARSGSAVKRDSTTHASDVAVESGATMKPAGRNSAVKSPAGRESKRRG